MFLEILKWFYIGAFYLFVFYFFFSYVIGEIKSAVQKFKEQRVETSISETLPLNVQES